MSYCINPFCKERHNPDEQEICLSCGNPLLINGRIRLIRPLTFIHNKFNYTDVFEVEDIGIHSSESQTRILKVLYWNDDTKYAELFHREALILQSLKHPGIPKSHREDYFTFTLNDDFLKLPCIVMQKFEGKNLKQWIESYGKITETLAYNWLFQLIEILDLVHRSGFFHRDIKPENIICQPNGELALVDFGGAREITKTYLAKVSTSGGISTGTSLGYEVTTVRTACYSPLEQINGQAVPQSDFYALGRTLVYLVTGIPLIKIKSDDETGRLLWRDKAQHIDKNIADLIDDLMAPFPGQRPQSTQVIIQRLERLPLQTKIERLIKSKLFKISLGIFGIFGLVGIIYSSLPLVANYYLNEGKKAYQENKFDEAKNDFKKAVRFNSKLNTVVGDYLLIQAKKAYAENQLAQADKNFQGAMTFNHELTYSISSFYFEQGFRHQNEPKIARKNYEQAIKYNPKDDTAYNNLAIACQQLYDYNCVKKTYEIIFKLKPNKWESHYGLGNFYDGQGEYDLAEKQYKIAIKSSGQAMFAVAALARLKNKKGDHRAAATLALRGLQKTNNRELQASLYKDLGWARLMENKLTEAQKYLEKATKLDSERTDAYCLLSQLEESLGQFNYARAYIDACILTKSSLPEVFRWRQELLDRILDK
ncbi:tetratricopeptide repeat protein [Nostoc flagelliforme FACHB-838]|uniref:non-specific serine/threonine protein kinase n=1 Tax=Nostoc flagelliforme FACHB-838 TaxID=2692904 RepID=A0ABR8E2G7_9NOSO|nr:tetratricopeptide repeat protein [Nostoc flagelliforme FACHB-838]